LNSGATETQVAGCLSLLKVPRNIAMVRIFDVELLGRAGPFPCLVRADRALSRKVGLTPTGCTGSRAYSTLLPMPDPTQWRGGTDWRLRHRFESLMRCTPSALRVTKWFPPPKEHYVAGSQSMIRQPGRETCLPSHPIC